MPLIDYARPEDVEGELKDLLGGSGVYQKRSLLMEVAANHEHVTKGLTHLGKHVMHSGHLDTRVKEIIGVVVSQINECEYCIASHRENLFKLKIPNDQILAIAKREYEELPAKMRDVAKFSELCVKSPNSVNQSNIEMLKDHGYTDEEIIEMMGVVGLFLVSNTMASVLSVDSGDRGDDLERYLHIERDNIQELADTSRGPIS